MIELLNIGPFNMDQIPKVMELIFVLSTFVAVKRFAIKKGENIFETSKKFSAEEIDLNYGFRYISSGETQLLIEGNDGDTVDYSIAASNPKVTDDTLGCQQIYFNSG